MSKAKNTESREMHKRLALKITVKFLALVLVFEVALILLGLLFLVIMGATNLDRTVWFEALKPFLIPLLIVLSVAGCGYISYRFMLRPLEHLDEVAEAAKQLAHPTDAPILLSHDLKSIEDDLNLVREQTLNSIKDAREADIRKDDLLVYLAHDLKTPLTSVLGYLKLMEDEPEIDPALIKKYSGIAGRKAERLESLINEFFEITRFSTHKLSLEPAKTNLSRMLMQITYEFHPILTEKDLEWDLQIPENIEIVCDRDKLERAIDNLIRNAINYSYAGTTIWSGSFPTTPATTAASRPRRKRRWPSSRRRSWSGFLNSFTGWTQPVLPTLAAQDLVWRLPKRSSNCIMGPSPRIVKTRRFSSLSNFPWTVRKM